MFALNPQDLSFETAEVGLAPLSAFSSDARRTRLCSGGLETRLRPLHQPFRIGDGATVLKRIVCRRLDR
jgi:hypothetical protein